MKLVDRNFSDYINYDFGRYYSCEESGCDTICRCSTIFDVEITDIRNLTSYIYDIYFDDSTSTKRNTTIDTVLNGVNEEINIYLIDRIIRYYKLYETESWIINIEHSYYGEEIDSIKIENNLALKIENDLNKVFSFESLNEKIKFILNLEYGYVMDKLSISEYEINSIDKSDIIYGNEIHLKNIKSLDLNFYNDKNYHLIRGIVFEKNINNKIKYQLIDGYHRVSSTNLSKVKIIKAFFNDETKKP